MKKTAEQKFEHYQILICCLLQGEILNFTAQNKLLELQKPSVGNNVDAALE